MKLLMLANVFMGFSNLSTEQHLSSTDAEGLMFRPVLTYHITTVAQSSDL